MPRVKRGGEFYTPRCIVQLAGGDAGAVSGSGFTIRVAARGGMFVQSASGFIEEHSRRAMATAGRPKLISRYLVRSRTTRRGDLAKMNLAIRGIEG